MMTKTIILPSVREIIRYLTYHKSVINHSFLEFQLMYWFSKLVIHSIYFNLNLVVTKLPVSNFVCKSPIGAIHDVHAYG